MSFPAPSQRLDCVPLVRFVVVLGLLVSCLPVWAARMEGLYDASVTVSDREADSRGPAIASALEKVLIKVSGDPQVIGSNELTGVLRDADRYVQQYRYDPALQLEGPVAEPSWNLVVKFDPESVDRLLRERKLPVWGDQRPETLLWLVTESAGRRSLAGSDNDPEVFSLVRRLDSERGVRVLLPLLDLEDRSRLQAADVWGDFSQAILDASERYKPDAVLVGRVGREGGQWLGRWTLYQGDTRDRWESRAASRRDAVYDGLQQDATALALRFAPRATDGLLSELRLDVVDVSTFEAYARLERYLRDLNTLADAQVERVEPDRIRFRVKARGGEESLRRAISLGDVLSPAPPVAFSSAPVAVAPTVAAQEGTDAVTQPLDAASPAAGLNDHPAAADTVALAPVDATIPATEQAVPSLSYRLVP
ncbi:MAG: DUF2066 domain-containing protein [Chromatiales bacterium]|nr:DUF2066 domain-containing protein [Chromatiales bacterium]